MKRQIQRDWEAESTRLKQVQNEQVSLQHAVGVEVRQEIKQKRSGLTKVLPFVPAMVSILAAFVGIPPGVTDIFASWFGDFGANFDLSEILSF